MQSLKSFGIDMMLIALNEGNFEVVHPSAKVLLVQNKIRYVGDANKLKLLGALYNWHEENHARLLAPYGRHWHINNASYIFKRCFMPLS